MRIQYCLVLRQQSQQEVTAEAETLWQALWIEGFYLGWAIAILLGNPDALAEAQNL